MEEARDKLYDAYLDEASGGRAEVPEDFLRRHGIEDIDLLDALRSIHAQVTQPREPVLAQSVAGQDAGDGDGHAPLVGDHVGEFTLIRKLGEGGMGVVWLVEQRSLRRVVALKILRAEAAMSVTAGERFAREARVVAKLRHPGIVAVYAFGEGASLIEGTPGKVAYIAMEHVEGRGLDEVLAEARVERTFLPASRVIGWGIALSRALHAAHGVGIVHRDVKPSNIRITHEDAPKLLDFGLARDMASGQATLTEAFVGSPFYAAPEQVARKGGEIDARTDVYALACVLYEALTGATTAQGQTLEQVLRSILMDEAASPRTINPRVSKDLATVVLKALEKDPKRRYQSASAFADDLEAILELRAISARPTTSWERVRRWVRGNKAIAASLATTAVAGIVLTGVLAAKQASEARARKDEAARLVAEADASIAQYTTLAERVRSVEVAHASIAPERGSRYFTSAEDAELAALTRQVEDVRRQREALFEAAQLELARAERLGAGTGAVQRVRARWYVAVALDAETRGDIKRRETFAEMARAHDVDGEVDRALVGTGELSIMSEPSGAEVYLYRRAMLATQAGADEPRRVPVPVGGWGELEAMPAGGFALRVVRGGAQADDSSHTIGAGAVIVRMAGFQVRGIVLVSTSADARIKRFDRLLRVDGQAVEGDYETDTLMSTPSGTQRTLTFQRLGEGGGPSNVELFDITTSDAGALGLVLKEPDALVREAGVPIEVWGDQGATLATSGAGLDTRTTAIPMPLLETARIGITPVARLAIEPGAYVMVLRRDGHELVRSSVVVGRNAPTVCRATLPEVGSGPDGFVLVTDALDASGDFWMMEREVTCREYFEFLNDPKVLARISASGKPMLHPRDGDTARGQKDSQGRFALPDGWHWEWPILFVSWHDARAYAEWRTTRARAHGQAWTFSLPTLDQWVTASSPAPGEQFAFGPEFRPKWVSSCFARLRPDPEPVMRFPIDESTYGIFDMAGSVSEWCDDVWRAGYEYRRHAGGAWGTGDPLHFMVYGGNGIPPEKVGGMIGFRLVATRPSKPALDEARSAPNGSR